MRALSILILLLCTPPAPAQSGRPAPESLARRLAPCMACHGAPEGAPAAERQGPAHAAGAANARRYYPRIAGKPAGYLLNQLRNFRDGRRQYPPMTWMVEHLSDDYLHEIAVYFAAQHLPAPVLPRAGIPAAQLERGRRLVLEGDRALKVPACVACHGARLTGALPAIPGLLGLPRDYINAQFGAWRNGARRAHAPDCMATVAGRLSLSDVAAISGWLASEPAPADAAPATTLTRPLPLACGSAPEHGPEHAREDAP
jgi:cytochrome c553